MRIDYSPRAEADLEDIVDNYLLVSKTAAEKFGDLFDACMADLTQFPHLGERRPHSRFERAVGRSGFHVLYEIRGEVIWLLRIDNVRRRRV